MWFSINIWVTESSAKVESKLPPTDLTYPKKNNLLGLLSEKKSTTKRNQSRNFTNLEVAEGERLLDVHKFDPYVQTYL